MSQYSNADARRVYNMAAEYVDETQRYIRMIIEADPQEQQAAEYLLKELDKIHEHLVAMRGGWIVSLGETNPDWDVTG